MLFLQNAGLVCAFTGLGDYYYTHAELSGLGEASICLIVIDVHQPFPTKSSRNNNAMELMDEEWQFPCAYAAIDVFSYPNLLPICWCC